MIDVRIIEQSGVEHVYQDVWDVEMDSNSVSGVDFYEQEGRKASFGILADEWIEGNFIQGLSVPILGYLPFLVEIRKDGAAVFSGFCKNDSETEFDRKRMICRISICDLLYVLLDVNKEEIADVTAGTEYVPAAELTRTMTRMLGTATPLLGYFGMGWTNNYADTPLAMNLLVYVPKWDWTSGAWGNALYSLIVRQGFVAYQVDTDWLVEYTLFDRQAEQEDVWHSGVRYRKFTERQHLYWAKWFFDEGTLAMAPGDLINHVTSTHSVEYSYDEYTIQQMTALYFIWLRDHVPLITADYTIHATNGIVTWTVDDEQWRISDTMIQKRVNPVNMLQTTSDLSEVKVNDWLGGILRVLCAYLTQVGREIQAWARLDFPQANMTEVTEDVLLLPNPQITGAYESQISVSLPFIQDGAYIETGIKEFYRDQVLGAMPKRFSLNLDGLDYELGGTLLWRGWKIMVTAINMDLQKNISAIEGVGGR